jgi:hypothetical protein
MGTVKRFGQSLPKAGVAVALALAVCFVLDGTPLAEPGGPDDEVPDDLTEAGQVYLDDTLDMLAARLVEMYPNEQALIEHVFKGRGHSMNPMPFARGDTGRRLARIPPMRAH